MEKITPEEFRQFDIYLQYMIVESLAERVGHGFTKKYKTILFKVEDFYVAAYYSYNNDEISITEFVAGQTIAAVLKSTTPISLN